MATRLASPMSPASQWAAKPDRRHVLTFELGRLRRTRSALLGSGRGTRQMPSRTLLEIKRHSSGGSRANFRANSARRGPAARRARCGRRAADAGRATRSGTSRALRVRGSREMCGSAVREPLQIVVRSVWGRECSGFFYFRLPMAGAGLRVPNARKARAWHRRAAAGGVAGRSGG